MKAASSSALQLFPAHQADDRPHGAHIAAFEQHVDTLSHVHHAGRTHDVAEILHALSGDRRIFGAGQIARTGGDEFAVLATIDERAASTRARRLLSAIERMRVAWLGQNLGTTASIGLATSEPPHLAFDDLLSQTDAACFAAKELGGNRSFAAASNPDELRQRTRAMHSAMAAREAGYTEPDPRDDLSGEDVRRKLLILSRAAGHALEADAVQVDSLVPPVLAALAGADVDAALQCLDAPLRERYAAAYKNGEKLRFIARLQAGGLATVGLEALPAAHPLAAGAGNDNRVAIWSDRYREQPLVIQGPGAGAEVTAAALLDDALRIARGR